MGREWRLQLEAACIGLNLTIARREMQGQPPVFGRLTEVEQELTELSTGQRELLTVAQSFGLIVKLLREVAEREPEATTVLERAETLAYELSRDETDFVVLGQTRDLLMDLAPLL